MTNMLVRSRQIQAWLVENCSVFDAWRLGSSGAREPGSLGSYYLPQIITGQKQRLGMVYEALQAQATMLALMTSIVTLRS